MWLQEPQYCCRSHDVAAGAKIWLQDIQNSLQSSFSHFCRDLNLSQIHGLLEPLYLGFFCLQPNFISLNPG